MIQYDFGRQYPEGFRRKNEVESTLGRASTEIANFLAYLEGSRVTKRLTAKINSYNQDATRKSAYSILVQSTIIFSHLSIAIRKCARSAASARNGMIPYARGPRKPVATSSDVTNRHVA